MRIIAFLILAAFYGCYFVKMLQHRKKGIQTDQLGKGKWGLTKFIEITMKIAACLTPFAEIVSIIIGTALFPNWVRVLGVCIGVIGVVAFVLAVFTMRDNWRAGVSETDQTELVTEGIYGISRNPAFLGFDLVYIGILLMFFNLGLFLISAFAILMLHFQIVNVEEDFLISAFGEKYVDYKKRVHRYIGWKRIP